MKEKRNLTKRVISSILALSIAVGLVPNPYQNKLQAEATTAIDASTGFTTYAELTSETTMLEDGIIYTVPAGTNVTTTSLAVAAGATAVICVELGAVLNANGANSTGVSGGTPGIAVPSGATLVITGAGVVLAKGGNAGTPAAGSAGGNVNYSNKYAYSGGAGGYGGQGASAGIGSAGGASGAGGTATTAITMSLSSGTYKYSSASGSNGSNGSSSTDIGNVYILGTVDVTATAGSTSSTGASGGSYGTVNSIYDAYFANAYAVSVSAGGGGGGAGEAADAIGVGGAGGGGGGTGGRATYTFGKTEHPNEDTYYYHYLMQNGGGGAGGTYFGTAVGGTPSPAGSSSIGGYYNSSSIWYTYTFSTASSPGPKSTSSTSGATGGTAASTNNLYGSAGGNGGNAGATITSTGSVYKSTNSLLQGSVDYTNAETHSSVQYTAKFVYDTSDPNGYYEETITLFGALPTIEPLTIAGYTFGGYFTEPNGGGTQYYHSSGIPIVTNWDIYGDITLYATYAENNYTISYNGNPPQADSIVEGSMPSETFRSLSAEDNYLATNNYSILGYTFKGWQNSVTGAYLEDGASLADVAITTTGYINLNAVWEASTSDVTFDAQGGKGGTYALLTYDEYTPTITTPSRSGYVFNGYYDDEECLGTMFFDERMYYNTYMYGDTEEKRWKTIGDITLYAKWEPLEYEVELLSDTDNYSETYVDTIDLVYGTFTLPNIDKYPSIVYSNYTFRGWNIYTGQNWAMYVADTELTGGLVESEDQIAKLYAAWEENPLYSITYNANGGTNQPSTEEAYLNNDYKISSIIPLREHYTFLGWDEDSSVSVPTYKINGTIENITSNIYLYAIWEENPSITYDANGGNFSTYVSADYPTKDTDFALTTKVPYRTGYAFAYWSENKDGTGTQYLSGATYHINDDDVTLYAYWEAEKLTASVVYTPDGWSVSGLSENYEDGDTVTFTVSGAEGASVSGYTVYENGIPISGNSFTITENVELRILEANSNYYFVTYIADGASDVPTDTKVYTSGSTVSVMFKDGDGDTPSKSGHTFLGWSTAKEATTATYTSSGTTSFDIGSSGVILYAVWEAFVYNVEFNLATDDVSAQTTATTIENIAYNEYINLPSASEFSRTGYNAVGFALVRDDAINGRYDFEVGSNDLARNLAETNGETVTLYVEWEPIQTKLIFNTNGGTSGMSVDYVWAIYGEPLTDGLNAPEYPGYIFAGWYGKYGVNYNYEYYDKNMDSAIENWSQNDSEITLTAKWTPITYNIELYLDTKMIYQSTALSYADSWTIPAESTFGDLGIDDTYYISGWAPVANSSYSNYNAEHYFDHGLTTTADETVKLYAVVSAKPEYTIRYESNGGTGGPTDDTSYKTGDIVDIKFSPTPSLAGYTFIGWCEDKDSSVPTYTENGLATLTMGDDYITLYAVWQANTYYIEYDNNSGSGIVSKNQFTYNELGTLSSGSTFSKNGYSLKGWAVSAGGDVVYAKSATIWNLTDVNGATVTLYAVWEKNTYTITLNNEGVTYLTIEKEYNTAYGYLPTPTTKYGHTFGGWYETTAALGDAITELDIFDYTRDLTLYAYWIPAEFTVIFNAYGGSVTPTNTTIIYGEKYSYLPTPTRDGYVFAGWYTEAEDGTLVTENDTFVFGETTTLYARWNSTSDDSVHLTIPTSDTYTIYGAISEYTIGDEVSFKVVAAAGYDVSEAIVKYNDIEITPESDGTYSFIITEDTEITVENVEFAKTTVSYDANGGSYLQPIAPQSYSVGATVNIDFTSEPIREGYVFLGYVDVSYYVATPSYTKNGTNSFTISNNDVTLYAVWEIQRYTLESSEPEKYTFDQSGNSYSYGTNIVFTIDLLSENGREISEVYANGILLLIPNDNGEYTVEIKSNTVINVFFTDDDITLSTITLKLNDGSLVSVNDDFYREIDDGVEFNYVGIEVELPLLSNIEKTGYTFVGWYNSASFSGNPITTISANDHGDKTFYAKYVPKTYTISSNASGCTLSITNEAYFYEYGSDITFTLTAFEGIELINLQVLINNQIQDTTENGIYTFKITQDTIITVIDNSPPIYQVTLETNNGTILNGDVKTYTEGIGAILPTNITKSGYVFAGWYEDIEFTGEIVPKILTTDTGAKIYYAKWTESQGSDFAGDILDENEDVVASVDDDSNFLDADENILGSVDKDGIVSNLEGEILGSFDKDGTYTEADGTILGTLKKKPNQNTGSSPSGSSGSATGDSSSSLDEIIDVKVIIDGVTYNMGNLTVDEDNTYVEVSDSDFDDYISYARDDSNIQIISTANNDFVSTKIPVKSFINMSDKNIDLIIQIDDSVFTVNTNSVDIKQATDYLKIEYLANDAMVNFQINRATSEQVKEITAQAQNIGVTLTGIPTSFIITIDNNNDSYIYNDFDDYLKYSIKVSDGITPTTVVRYLDGDLSHVPTRFALISGELYSTASARMNAVYVQVIQSKSFIDATDTWYEQTVLNLANRLIINGVTATEFKGVSNITRAEFITIVVRALGLEEQESSGFNDINGTEWYSGYVNSGYNYGLIAGDASKNFNPTNYITRQEAMIILQRTAQFVGYNGHTSSVGSYSDVVDIATWAMSAAEFNVGSGLFQGNNNLLRPLDLLTRAETATIIERLLEQSKFI